MLRSAGQFRKRGGEWETFYVPREEWPGMSDPERFDLVAPPEKPPRILYPTLMQMRNWEIEDRLQPALDRIGDIVAENLDPATVREVVGA